LALYPLSSFVPLKTDVSNLLIHYARGWIFPFQGNV